MLLGFIIMDQIREWGLPIAILVLTGFGSAAAKVLCQRLGQHPKRNYLLQLGPPLSSLIYIFGLRAFGDVAPIHPKLLIWLENGVYVLAVILILNLFRRAALTAFEWGVGRRHSPTLQLGFLPAIRNVLTLFVFMMGGIMILKHFNYDVMSLLAALGVGSLAVGLAAKETLSNMISGFILIIDRNLKPGDRINLAGSVGDVDEIGLRSTRIRTGDGNLLIVPNSDLVNNRLINLSLPTRQGVCSTTFKFPYSVPFQTIKQICADSIAKTIPAVPGKNWIHLSSLNEGCQTVTFGFWLKEMDDQAEALTQFHGHVLEGFQKKEITFAVPSPQLRT